ncbi:RNA polymerase sigma factor [Kineococcus sp. NBC_00420]|uniref:RNA polymerase sigma factor n=1 Tax=Kineococcus sp. NBC_00420 TaxID=2903564 RepID=UPI002E1D7165
MTAVPDPAPPSGAEQSPNADAAPSAAAGASSEPPEAGGGLERRARPRGTSDLHLQQDQPRGQPGTPDSSGISPVPDDVLIRQAGLGDKNAFAQIVTRHGPALYRYVSRILHETTDAQDCVQETMLSAWKNIATFRGDSTLRTWLLVMGRHEAQKILQRRRRHFPQSGSRPVIDFDDAVAQLRDLHNDPEGDTIDAGLLAALDAALLLLPERQRSVWILREIEDLSYAEIATVVGVTPVAVRGLLNRARTAITTTLEEWR